MVCESGQGIYFFMFLVFDTQKSGKCKIIYRFFVKYLAEREGFEPNFISKKSAIIRLF